MAFHADHVVRTGRTPVGTTETAAILATAGVLAPTTQEP
jgi:hypothetical protein